MSSDSLEEESCSQQRFFLTAIRTPPTFGWTITTKDVVIVKQEFRVLVLGGEPGLGTNDYISFGVTSQVAKFYTFIPKALKIYDQGV